METNENIARFDGDVMAALAGCVIDNRDIMRDFNRNSYLSSFKEYREKYKPLFAALEELYAADGEAVKIDAVRAFMGGVAEHVSASSKPTSALDQLRFVIALYFVPMVRSLKLNVSEPFCLALRDEWAKTYPKFEFKVGDYETIVEGFNKKFLGLCFITTAVCEHSGKPDDCYELTAFRAFRDGYLASSEGGAALIDEYYEIAPAIVTCIDLFAEKDAVYPMLREKYLAPCLDDIENGRLEACKNRYIDMVHTLRHRYLGQ